VSWNLLNAGSLMAALGLAGVAIPVVIHLLNRRRATVVDWGAMQFLDLGRRARRKFQLTELLLMAGRMALLGLVALALMRPFWVQKEPEARAADSGSGSGPFGGGRRRDVVIVLDGSDSMGRKAGKTTPRAEALAWAGQFVAKLGPGDSVAVLVAKDRVKPLVAPASFDLKKVAAALADAPPARGASDLPAALNEALRLLEAPGNPARDIILLTDGQRFAWRPDEPARWAVLREVYKDLARRSGVAPRLWAIPFGAGAGAGAGPDGPNGSVAPLELSRGLITPNLPITVTTAVANAGPGPLTRTAELLVDGQAVPGSAQVVGPIPAGGKAPLSFKASIAAPGSHALAVRLAGGDDALPGDDEAACAVEVTAALPVLLVDGEPGAEPLSSETDFLRAALAPAGAETLQAQARVVRADAFAADDLKGRRVAVLANVERLDPGQAAAIAHFLDEGGGVLVAPGDKTDSDFANTALYQGGSGWLPAKLGAAKGDAARRQAVAHPAPRTFTGPALAPFGRGDDPALGGADLFAYRLLVPAKGASVTARLDTGDPWIVERPYRKGRVAVLAGPIDAEGGTLPVNPDFVPWAHELIFRLADADSGARSVRPGEPIVLDLAPAPPPTVTSLAVTPPDGSKARAEVTRIDGKAQARFDATGEPGLYRIRLPDPPGGSAYATVAADGRESDLRPLEPAEAKALAEGWPLTFEAEPGRLAGRLFAADRGGRNEVWRLLVLAALGGLCMEVWLTRRLVMSRGIAEMGGDA